MSNPNEVVVILNPKASAAGYDERRIEGLRDIAGSRAVLFVLEQPDLIDAVIEGARERGVQTVGIIGGDGSISFVLSALYRTYGTLPLPRIALLRGGTMNTIANSLAVRRGSPEDLLRRLLANLSTPFVERNTLEVEDRLGFLFSTGAMVGFLQVLYDSDKSERGPLAALKLLARGSWQAFAGGDLAERIEKPLIATMTVDDDVHPERRYVVVGAATIDQVGLGFRAFPRVTEGRNQFQLFAFHGSLQSLARHLPRLRRGQPVTKGLGFEPLAKLLQLRTDGAPITYALDGDIYETTSEITVAIGPRVQVHLI
jgi:diacylglycerol kinase (ATP)